jgi:hypothetical protein
VTSGDDEDDDAPESGPRLSGEVRDHLPDVRDGLTRIERIVLWQLHETQREFPGRNVPTATLYGRVVEHVSLSEREFLRVLSRLVGTRV